MFDATADIGKTVKYAFILIAIFFCFLILQGSYNKIANFLGIETKESVQKKLDQSEANNATLESNLDNQKKNTDLVAENAKLGDKAEVQLNLKKIDTIKIYSAIKKTRDNIVQKVNSEESKPEVKIEKTSEANIDALWASYTQAIKDTES